MLETVTNCSVYTPEHRGEDHMGKRGPKPMSGEELKLRGSRLTTRRLAEEEEAKGRAAALAETKEPWRTDPPAWLSEEAVIVYEEAVLQLRATGTPFADRATMARYAVVSLQNM